MQEIINFFRDPFTDLSSYYMSILVRVSARSTGGWKQGEMPVGRQVITLVDGRLD